MIYCNSAGYRTDVSKFLDSTGDHVQDLINSLIEDYIHIEEEVETLM